MGIVNAARDRKRSYAQHGEDLLMLKLLGGQKQLVVDVGANDGVSWSNSRLFGLLGFPLLLIEPIPVFASQCRRIYEGESRVAIEECVVSQQKGERSFYVQDQSGDPLAMQSSLDRAYVPGKECETISVPSYPLADLLRKHGCPPDYSVLSVDVEGTDLEVLQSAELQVFRPRLICVEEGEGVFLRTEVKTYLAEQGYDLEAKFGANALYIRRSGPLDAFVNHLRRALPARLLLGLG